MLSVCLVTLMSDRNQPLVTPMTQFLPSYPLPRFVGASLNFCLVVLVTSELNLNSLLLCACFTIQSVCVVCVCVQ